MRGLLPRPELIRKLEACLGSPLVLVSAPAGFGKTSLAMQYLASLSATTADAAFPGPAPRTAWVSLEREDDDPVRFWGAVAGALELAAEPDGSSPFAPLLSATRAPQPPSARELGAALAEAVDSIDGHILLVLDDFHLISSQEVLGSFARFAERPPERLRVIILSRCDPPLPMARLRAGGFIAELRAADLRFTSDEAASLLCSAALDRLSPEQARKIADKTEGWGAGLRLAAISLGRKMDVEAFISGFSGGDRFVLEYLTEEVLGFQSEETQSFLLKSAVLERFCSELCDAAIGPAGGSAAMIKRVESAGLFLVPLDDEGRWHRYHQLFAETLRARLRALAPEVEAEVLAKAAAWHESRGNQESALELRLRAGDKA
ncbi:MAG TPA: helix-turn-helix transcriptional regulator, partial [Spirochaetaceae bacterium]|nr:helix-turn-helix transcriptional regulator [Spirochaetaceae bacterium]